MSCAARVRHPTGFAPDNLLIIRPRFCFHNVPSSLPAPVTSAPQDLLLHCIVGCLVTAMAKWS
jgi:hypothetical protein